ncbi:MAG: NAD(P)/FAD-dependent oxidoreductase [Deltaproteobacteria bacterium]|nr:NAD(P)/FAD-dependent oxidoreductase [Deltaproteobacteria bacterium]
MKNYVIIGQGVAGVTAAEHLRKQDQAGGITMLTDEDLPFYWRTRLNDHIAGHLDEKGLIVKDDRHYRNLSIDCRLNAPVVSADPDKKVVTTKSREEIPYDVLLVATGSHSFLPPIEGAEKKGVFALRSVQDSRDIRAHAQNKKQAVLIGGGLLGLETANALRKMGLRCKVIEFFPRLLPRQLDVAGAGHLQKIMEGMGLSFWLGAVTKEILGKDEVSGVRLESGETIEAEMVIVSAGVRPNLELAKPLGLEVDKGIIVDERMRTSREGVFAAGDVTQFNGMLYGIWPAAMEQGKIAGINMGGGEAVYSGTTMANILKVVGIDLASMGNIDAENEYESIVVSGENFYKKVVIMDNLVIGGIFLGDKGEFNDIKKLMEEQTDISKTKNSLLK